MKLLSLFLFLGMSFLAFGQPSNDECANAEELCPNMTLSGTTVGATTTASSDHSFCFTPSSTVWYKFTTNAVGGNVTISFTNLVFDPSPTKGQELEAILYEVPADCDNTSYLPYSACGSSGVDFDVISAVACNPNTTYYVQVNGTKTGVGVTEHADCDFDISISGPAVDKAPPTVMLSATETDFCQGTDSPLIIDIIDCDDTITYEWIYDGSSILTTTEDTFSTALLSDTGDLELVVTCGALCPQDDTSDAITFNVTPIAADAGPDKFIGQGDQVNLEGSGEGDAVWSPGTSLSSTNSYTPTASPDETTTYFLTVTNGPCTANDEVNVFVGEVIIIYSGFTPNGDGYNDKWVIGNSSQFPNMEVNIYDRSGQRVFSATNYDTPDKWFDGTYKGKDLPASAYYYVINLNNGGGDEDIYKGTLSIIR